MIQVSRRAALLGIPAFALGLSACGSPAPMDEEEVKDAVSQVDGSPLSTLRSKSTGSPIGHSQARSGSPTTLIKPGPYTRTAYEPSRLSQ